MSIQHVLPTDLAPSEGFQVQPDREQYSRRYPSGADAALDIGERTLRRYSGKLEFFKSGTDKFERAEAFIRQVNHRVLPWWLLEQWVSRFHGDVWCGEGDGSRTTWPVPIREITGSGILVVGVPQLSGYTLHSYSQLLPDDESCNPQTDASHFEGSISGGSLALSDLVAADGLHSILATPGAAAANHYVQQIPGTYYATVTAASDYLGHAAVLPVAAESYRVVLSWYRSDDTPISTENGTTTACTAGQWTVLTVTGTAPALAAHAVARLERLTSSDEPFFSGCYGVHPGDLPEWYLRSLCPPCAEWTAAPADGSAITASGTGKLLCKVKFETLPAFAAYSPGRHEPGRIVAVEVL